MHNNKIIAEGFTSNYGGNHAEVNAVNAVKNKQCLKEATIYVSLEPCSHFGKTPPCADLLIQHQFKSVVIGCIDSNSLVAGRGIERLQRAAIHVVVGVLETECKAHHKRFFTVQEQKRPYIILKWAQTIDKFVAPLKRSEQNPVWISNNYSQQLVHKFRAQEQAILVGTNTVIADNPALNVRSWSGNDPIRIVLDKSLRIAKNTHIYDGSVKTIFITSNKLTTKKLQTLKKENSILFEQINFSENIAKQICEVLQKHKIQSVIIEGGTKTLQTFIDANLWDEARVFTGNTFFKTGIKAPILLAKITATTKIKNDILNTYTND